MRVITGIARGRKLRSPDGYDVRILVTLVAKDSHSHMEGIQAVSNIFADELKVNSLLNASTPQDIYNIFVENVG